MKARDARVIDLPPVNLTAPLTLRLHKPGANAIFGTAPLSAPLMLILCGWTACGQDTTYPPAGPLPVSAEPATAEVELGRLLFFDPRLSGDATISCATCHAPERGWADGLPLSVGYPGSRYFRNTPTILNAALNSHAYWDGRLTGSDLATVIRDHLAEAHFMQIDGRLAIERLRQVPEYESRFQALFRREPTYGGILNVLAAFVTSVRSRDVPFDAFISGDSAALSESESRGWDLFRGKAQCVRCHNGPMFTDGRYYSLGLQSNPEIFTDPQRHITFRRFFRTLGVPNYAALKQDPGCYCVTKVASDRERMRTPTLRELVHTAPYMHDGQLSTLEDVVAFYNSGGGPRASRDRALGPLHLSDKEQSDLVAFLRTLSGTAPSETAPELPAYQTRPVGVN